MDDIDSAPLEVTKSQNLKVYSNPRPPKRLKFEPLPLRMNEVDNPTYYDPTGRDTRPYPELNDDVLLDIFANLDVYVLYNLAKCSPRYESLVQRIFITVHKGKIILNDAWDIQELLPVFGMYARTLSCLVHKKSFPMIWPYLRVHALHTMIIDISQIDDMLSQSPPFLQMKHLCL